MAALRVASSSAPVTVTGHLWVGSIVIDCTDLARMVSFWQEALHLVPRDPPQPDGVILKDPLGVGPNISLNLTSEGPLEPYRLHLDLYSTDPRAEVDRLIRLGATLRRPAEKGHDFVTLADPDGNLFDVIDKEGWSFGQRA
ncbi:MAG TPA: VOC family protein [Thermoplasmata archaeon]|nr:VOC family protein [Thermoplasmata archaeon]